MSEPDRATFFRGFTLIELLIVVAIIAILAAIAVPNFLEAQVRSKVSRVKADLRSAATALEACLVDYGRYPDVEGSPYGYLQYIHMLSTRWPI
jgi:prepilin-type N-terminal cleavage/methylation domain-containing protein